MERTIPCDDCAEKTLDIQQLGFRVTGCNPHPTRPGFCVLTFEEGGPPQTAVAAAGALVAGIAPPAVTAAGVGAITATQATTAKAIVNLFETGEVLGQYGNGAHLVGLLQRALFDALHRPGWRVGAGWRYRPGGADDRLRAAPRARPGPPALVLQA